jgi:hypothetical protein
MWTGFIGLKTEVIVSSLNIAMDIQVSQKAGNFLNG